MALPHGGRAGGLFALLMVLAPLHGRAQLPEQVSIAWQDDGSCPRPLRLQLESEIAHLLGPRARNADDAEFEVQVERRSEELEPERRYRLTLTGRSASQRVARQLELASCSEAQDAAALLIATAIDPDAVLRSHPPPPPKEPELPRPPASKPHRWSLLLQARLDTNTLPKISGGPSAGVLLQLAHVRVWGEARYLFQQGVESTPLDRGTRLHADIDLFTVAAGAAYVWRFDSLVFGPAAALEFGALRAKGSGVGMVASGSSRGSPWGAVDLGAVAGYGVQKRIGLELGVYAGLPLSRPRLALREEAPFYTTHAVTMRVAVGLRISLGSH